MKNIGIMTMHRIINYGSFLQAYGLKKTLNELGFNVEFVDYEYEGSLIKISNNKKSLLKKISKNINIIKYIKRKIMTKKFIKIYNESIFKYLNVSDEKNIRPTSIDSLVIGSDEVFNCLQEYPVGFSSELFGNHYFSKNVISYAGCFGYTDYEGLKKYNKIEEVSEYFKKFKAISVRDKNSFNTIYKLTNIISEEHLDPVLIANFDSEIINSEPKYRNYIIIYAYENRLSEDEEKYIKRFAKKYKKKIISLGVFQKIADYNIVVEPLEVLRYFKYADYVITDTFHGTVFSIKMNTKFCTIVRNSNKNKLHYLLEKCNLVSQEVNTLESIEKIFNKKISFYKTNNYLMEERKKSLDYLKSNLK